MPTENKNESNEFTHKRNERERERERDTQHGGEGDPGVQEMAHVRREQSTSALCHPEVSYESTEDNEEEVLLFHSDFSHKMCVSLYGMT